MAKISQANLNLVSESLYRLPEQIDDVLKQSKSFKLPKRYKNVNKIVVSGMGGSNLGARIAASIFDQSLKFPIIINPSYEVPLYVDKNTLFIASSFSGNTEEVLSAYKEAKKHKAKIAVITSQNKNNKLMDMAKRDKTPSFAFNPQANPSNQPRLSLGYAIFALAIVMQKAGALKINLNSIKNANSKLKTWGSRLTPNKSNNAASKLADKLHHKNIIIVTGEFLEGNAHALRNQFCENSKNFADYLTLPDMNHYAMEGLDKPSGSNLIFLFFDSNLYSPRVQKRNSLTKEVVRRNKIKLINHKLNGRTKLEQSLEMLQLGSWVTLYLAELNNADPMKIPWVDWFKKQLK
ncbi:MAG: SIS domain-containing protein [bacterium]